MITLQYIDNVNRLQIGNISVQEITESENAENYLLQVYQNAGCTRADNPKNLYIKNSRGEIMPLDIVDSLEENITIFYIAILPLSNAAEFAREDGIVYFFHTSEQGHLGYPHIHAKHGKEEISVYFTDFHVIGKMKSPVMQRKAVTYVKKHHSAMEAEWDRITDSQKWR